MRKITFKKRFPLLDRSASGGDISHPVPPQATSTRASTPASRRLGKDPLLVAFVYPRDALSVVSPRDSTRTPARKKPSSLKDGGRQRARRRQPRAVARRAPLLEARDRRRARRRAHARAPGSIQHRGRYARRRRLARLAAPRSISASPFQTAAERDGSRRANSPRFQTVSFQIRRAATVRARDGSRENRRRSFAPFADPTHRSRRVSSRTPH